MCRVCRLCNRSHHNESVCLSKNNLKAKISDTVPNSAAVFDALCNCNDLVDTFDDSCTVSDSSFVCSVCIDHHVYDKLSDNWVKQKSKSQL